MEMKEKRRTDIWLNTKLRNEEKKFEKQSQKILLSNMLHFNNTRNTIPAFYKMLL